VGGGEMYETIGNSLVGIGTVLQGIGAFGLAFRLYENDFEKKQNTNLDNVIFALEYMSTFQPGYKPPKNVSVERHRGNLVEIARKIKHMSVGDMRNLANLATLERMRYERETRKKVNQWSVWIFVGLIAALIGVAITVFK
jgi:hypothetical protein